MLSIRNLAHQSFPRESAFFMDAYKQACHEPYGYLLGLLSKFFLADLKNSVNLHANSNNTIRLRTKIFPGEESIIFVPKNE